MAKGEESFWDLNDEASAKWDGNELLITVEVIREKERGVEFDSVVLSKKATRNLYNKLKGLYKD